MSIRQSRRPGESSYTREEIDVVVNELHRLGIEANSDANGESIRLAVEVGVNSIQHGGNLTDELTDLLIANDVGVREHLHDRTQIDV